MKGTRPLTIEEIAQVSESFEGIYEVRNRSLFILGISSGGRISELLSLTVADVWQNNKPVKDLHFNRNVVKGKENARSVPLSTDGTQAITDLIHWHREQFKGAYKVRPLFTSRQGGGRIAITRRNAHNILKAAFIKAGLNGNLATHSMRKSYAQRLYNQTKNLYCVREMLGHKSILTTQEYLGTDYAELREATEAISLHAYQNRS